MLTHGLFNPPRSAPEDVLTPCNDHDTMVSGRSRAAAQGVATRHDLHVMVSIVPAGQMKHLNTRCNHVDTVTPNSKDETELQS